MHQNLDLLLDKEPTLKLNQELEENQVRDRAPDLYIVWDLNLYQELNLDLDFGFDQPEKITWIFISTPFLTKT